MINRRTFMKGAAATTAALTVSPNLAFSNVSNFPYVRVDAYITDKNRVLTRFYNLGTEKYNGSMKALIEDGYRPRFTPLSKEQMMEIGGESGELFVKLMDEHPDNYVVGTDVESGVSFIYRAPRNGDQYGVIDKIWLQNIRSVL